MTQRLRRWRIVPAALVIALALWACEPIENGDLDDPGLPGIENDFDDDPGNDFDDPENGEEP